MERHCRGCASYMECKAEFYSEEEYEKYDFDEQCLVCDNYEGGEEHAIYTID